MTNPTTTKNIISEDVEIRGTVMFQSSFTMHGKIDGDILTPGTLIIGANGTVNGDIQAAAVTVAGYVKGNVTVDKRCELKGEAEVVGDVEAPMLAMDEGVTFVGQAKIQPRANATPMVVPKQAPAQAAG